MKKRIAGYLLGLLVLATLRAAPALPGRPPLQHPMMGVANGCFVETVAFLDHWADAMGPDAWARLLQWGAREDEEVVMGHAVAICERQGVLWSWDINHGWNPLPVDIAQREAPEKVIVPVLTKYPRVAARYPIFRFDFPQTPAAAVPAPKLADPNTSIRDASIVGATLARKRPVNVVRFAHGAGEVKQESAAVVFVFHGRYCMYIPEAGTVPFRGRGDVANLRLTQDLLRRMFPGVTGVRKME